MWEIVVAKIKISEKELEDKWTNYHLHVQQTSAVQAGSSCTDVLFQRSSSQKTKSMFLCILTAWIQNLYGKQKGKIKVANTEIVW